ncbi:PLP-dependent transferase [Rhizodiscina lignyota]|uniref:PLP-dependent transferase n=1 Tax=Rhizodiscina lignyota TaxID=1504668 RepID=A0A9P4IPI1_9PEZI|nr:PLP-dependent transferase [Rhizodiscina lignyota]
MVKIEPFALEIWMDKFEKDCKYNIAETCCASISLDKLQELSEDKTTTILPSSKILNYGAIRGSESLRGNLSRLYSAKTGNPLPAENILITPGAIAANHLFLYSFVGPGDHVICHYPTYQQLYSIPESLGAEVDLWKAKSEKNWIPDIEELKSLIKPNTKLIIINNPNNPTGAVLPKTLLQNLIDVASTRSPPITILSDEVYRPVFHSISPMDAEFPPSILSMGYRNAVSTGSMSKAYSLAGIRTGWIASRNPDIIETCAQARDYTTISVSQLDEQVAAFALSPSTIHALLSRNIQLAKTNLSILAKFVDRHDDICSWVSPKAGTTAFVRFHREGNAIDSAEFCKRLLDKTGVLFAPGKESFGDDFEGYVRIGYVCETEVLKGGLDKTKVWLRKEFDDIPLAA